MNIANDLGWKNLTLRTGFNAEMAERHAAMAKDAAKAVAAKPIVENVPSVPATIPLYYEDVSQQNFEASVLACLELSGEDIPEGATHGIVLDRTCFYPEGGGQEGDHGSLTCDSASNVILD
jgi:alanyl-tRNA synthetase